MSVPHPTNNAPVGLGNNRFKLDNGTLALTQMRPPGLRLDPWGHLTLAEYGAFLRSDFFVGEHRFAAFGGDRREFDAYANRLLGTAGGKLKRAVMDAARECKVSPGLLAAVMLFEQHGAAFWKDRDFFLRGGLESLYEAGADDFLYDQENIRRAVPAARRIVVVSTKTRFDEERKADRKDGFVAVDQLVLVTAAMVKYKELIVRTLFSREGCNFDTLREYERFYFTRLAYNPGGQLLKTIRDFLQGGDVFERAGPRSRKRPRRGATLCTALALHLNRTVFM